MSENTSTLLLIGEERTLVYIDAIFKNVSVAKAMFLRLASCFSYILIIYLLSLTKFCFPFHFVFFALKGFVLASSIAAIIASYKVFGFFIILLSILPIELVLTSLLIFSSCYGVNCSMLKIRGRRLNNSFLIIFILCLLVCAIELLLITIILRPLFFII